MARTVQRRRRSRKKIIIPIIIVLIALLLAVGSYFCYRFYDQYRERNGRNQTDEYRMITISEQDTIDDVVRKLKDAGIIKYADKLSEYFDRQGKFALNVGDIALNRYEAYPDIFAAVKKTQTRETFTIRFTEGDEVGDIIDTFVENGIGTKSEFEYIAATYDFGYDYIPAAGSACRLEGFLYPDTYEFYKNTSPQDALQKLIDTFDARISDDTQALIAKSDMSFYEILTLASIVQKESGTAADMPKVASVFLNRLKIGMKLQSDACYNYRIPKERRTYSLTYDQIGTDDPYNTYYYEGLPPTPITNPTIAAIQAVLRPADTNYLYFCFVGNGVTKFAETFAQHKVNVAEFEAWYKSQNG